MQRAHDLALPQDPEGLRRAQQQLAETVGLTPSERTPRTWGAVDVAYAKSGPDLAFGVAIVMDAQSREVIEVVTWSGPPPHDYVPGLFALREGACLIATLDALQTRPDVLFIDGQGIAHPRGFGLACQIGITFDIPTVGVAKRRLYGDYEPPGEEPGLWSPLRHQTIPKKIIGGVLRTQVGVKPVFVSPGHGCDVKTAMRWATAARSDYRILEPIRAADIRTRQLRDGRS